MNVESLQIISKFMNDYEYEKAMELCDELLKKDNENSHLWALKGCCLNHFEKYVEAMECYNRSLSEDDENPFIWFHVGKILMEYDLFDEAWSEVKIPSYTVTKADTFKKLILAFNGEDLNEIH